MSSKLKHDDYVTLTKACAEHGVDEASDLPEIQTIFENMTYELEAEFETPPTDVSSPRALFYVLHGIGDSLAFNGVRTGLACNRPYLVKPGIAMAKAVNRPKTAEMLEKLLPLLAPEDMEDLDERLNYFEADPARDEAMSELEAMSDSAEFHTQGWIVPALEIMLKSPEAFFEMSE